MITVIDSIMGSGKTTYMTKLMNEAHTQSLGRSFIDPEHKPVRFLYVAPLLSEVDRISEACRDLSFRNPQPVECRKLYHLSTLIEEGANICTTHALFRLLNRDIYRKLREQKYTLVIDEVLDCVNLFDLTASDRKLLFRDHLVYADPDTKRLKWNHRDHPTYSGKFSPIRDLCDNGNLVLYRDTALIWEFPTDFLRCFNQVYVLTYMFLGSPMSAYLRAEGLAYDMMTLKDKKYLVSWADHSDETETKEKLRSLISVYQGSANHWGTPKGRENPMSSRWYENLIRRSPDTLAQMKAATEHWFKTVAQTKANDNAWTTFKKAKGRLRGNR